MSFDRLYHDDPIEDQKSRASGKISGLLALVLTIFGAGFYLQTTLAANVSINSGNSIEFGQGSARTVACSGTTSLIITPMSSFINTPGESGSHKFEKITVSSIPTDCRGQDFIFSAYNNEANSAAQAIFNTSSTRAVVHMTEGDTFEKGIGGTGLSVITNSASSFTVTFTAPVAASSNVFNLTVESVAHTPLSCFEGGDCIVGDMGPGGGTVFYVLAAGFSCGPDFTETGSPTGGKCKYLESAPTTGADGWVYDDYAFSGNTDTGGTLDNGIGRGYQTTLAYIAQDLGDTPGTALTAARAYRGPYNYSDWYVPSRATQAVIKGLWTAGNRLNFGLDKVTWSSTGQVSQPTNAWYLGLYSNGTASDNRGAKSTIRTVHPIRAF